MEPPRDTVRVAILIGSVRPGNYSTKAARLVADEFTKHGIIADLIDPATLDLPMPGIDLKAPGPLELQRRIREAAAVVLVTPEYHGSFSSVMKLAIENMGFPSPMSGKPVALLGVAAGTIGAIKSLEALRGVVSHVGALALPMPVSVANVQSVFDESGACLDPAIEKHVRRVATTVLDYLGNHVCPKVTLERILREGVAATLAE
jgi:chromate reductase, NAD(P)H dehydrogenase (quinone)